MVRTIEKMLFKFDELEDSAKEKAREWFRQGQLDYDWYDSVYEDAVRVGEILGIEFDQKPVKLMGGGTRYDPTIFFTGFYSQGDGACFEGRYSYRKGAAAKHAKPGAKITMREYASQDTELQRIATDLYKLQRRHFYRLEARVKHRGHYYHSLCTEIDVTDSHTGYDAPREAAEDLAQLLRDFMHWLYRQLEKECEWLRADEQVDDSIRANEYEFDENGSIV